MSSDPSKSSVLRASRFDPALLDMLVCPVSGGVLRYDEHSEELICDASGLAYPVRDGIPIMLADEARKQDAGK